jgi:hypothetical protein
MPFDGAALHDLAAVILQAHRAAVRADDIANVAIRVSLKKRVAAGEALSAARQLLDPDRWLPWLTEIGRTIRDARRYANFPTQAKIEARYKRYGGNKGHQPPRAALPTSLTAARLTLDKMDRELDHAPLTDLARIERIADAMKFLFWDCIDIRTSALDIALRAGARLRQPQERHPRPHHRAAFRDAAD